MTNTVPAQFKVIAFFAADHAEALNGKVYLNGGFWNRLRFPQYPAVISSMALVAVVEVPFHEYQKNHRFSAGMVDADGQELSTRVEGEFRVGAPPELRPGDPSLMPLAIKINGLKVERPGDYSFTFAIDGREVSRFPIRAVQIATPMQFELDDQT